MGDLEINYHRWTADATVNRGFDDPANIYQWLANSRGQLIGDWFEFTGLDTLAAAFAYAAEYGEDEPSPIASDVYTAVCYLFFANFLALNRDVHQLAKDKQLGLGNSHLLCTYGDLLYHSVPTS